MRLHRIALENLSSLYGEHVVDLDEDLGGASLFVIVGPTGSGKSTVLDAVSLALFGETPRLDNSRARDRSEDVDSRHIMSRGTGACRAVLDFSRADGDGTRTRYRASWSCHRANRLPDGAFQTVKRSLERARDDDSFELLVDDHRKKVYEPHFERALDGLTVQDFQRSILLAQGEFTALLKASPDEKAAILERLTSTEVYADIGRRASHLRREATKAFEKAQTRLDALQVLSPADLEELEARRAEAEARQRACRVALDRREAAVRWLAREETLAREVTGAEREREAAAQARAEASADLARLEEDERCRPAAALAEAAARDAREQTSLAERADLLSATLLALDRELEPARDALTAATTARDEAREARREAAPRLTEARRLAEAARHERAGATTARAAAEQAARAHAEASEALEEVRDQLGDKEEQLATVTERLEALAAARELPDAVSGLEARWSRLGGEDARAARLTAAAATSEEEATQAKAAMEAARSALAEAKEAFAAEPTPERDAETLRASERALAQRIERLRAVESLAGRRDEAKRALEDRQTALDEIWARLEEARETAAEERVELKRARAERDAADQRLDDLRLAVSLIDHRDRLVDAEPCPLCGSPDHPYRRDPEIEAKDRELRQRRDTVASEVERLRAGVGRAEKALAARDRAVTQDETLANQHQHEVDRGREALAHAEEALRATADAAEVDAAQVATAISEAVAAREAVVEEQRALAAAARRREEIAGLANALALAEGAHTAASRRREENLTAARRARQEADALASSLAVTLAEHGIDAPGGTRRGLEEAVREATRLAASVRQVTRARDGLRSEVQTLIAARDAKLSRVEEAAAQRARADEAADLAEGAARDAEARAGEALDGAAPEVVEERLDARVTAATAALDEARRGIADLEQRRASAAGQAEEVRDLAAQVAARAEASREALEHALAELELPDEEALAARLLPDEARATLKRRREALTRDEAAARARSEAASVAQSEHAARRPDSLADDATAAGTQAALAGARTALEEASEELGALTNDVTQHQALLRRHADEKRDWEARRETMNLWKRLHRLIGEGDGRAFQEYAQTLNLQELVDRANGHLRALAPRYALVTAVDAKGRARLDFAIRDAWLAGRQRPITTLSGGETFQVSLALALGLADMRTRGMRLETLLLDEGFGTLDPRSLDHAVDALERLHARSRIQVGVISHVEALRERIEARIVIEALGNGHSRLRPELGGRGDAAPPDEGAA